MPFGATGWAMGRPQIGTLNHGIFVKILVLYLELYLPS